MPQTHDGWGKWDGEWTSSRLPVSQFRSIPLWSSFSCVESFPSLPCPALPSACPKSCLKSSTGELLPLVKALTRHRYHSGGDEEALVERPKALNSAKRTSYGSYDGCNKAGADFVWPRVHGWRQIRLPGTLSQLCASSVSLPLRRWLKSWVFVGVGLLMGCLEARG